VARTYLFQKLQLFSPQKGGFLFPAGLTQSPLDILLTSLVGFSILVLFLILYLKTNSGPPNTRSTYRFPLGLQFGLLCLVPGWSYVFSLFLKELVTHVNLNLLVFRLDSTFLIFHSSIFLVSLSGLILMVIILHYTLVKESQFRHLKLIFFFSLLTGYGFYSILRNGLSPGITEFILLTFLGLYLATRQSKFKLKTFGLLSLSLLILVTFSYLYTSTNLRSQKIIETSLSHLIIHQSSWGNVLIQEATTIIDEEEDRIRSLFNSSPDSRLAQNLWEKTPLSRFNWYSRLEILDNEGFPLSRFSLNVPESFALEEELLPHREWQILKTSLNFFNERRPFLIAYRDFFAGERPQGRVQLFLSLDPRNLPFLYSANPYFELLRSNPLPSLIEVNFIFVIYDQKGNIVFNPNRLNHQLSLALIDKFSKNPPHWESFSIDQKNYLVYFLPYQEFIYAFYLPQENLFSLGTSFLKTYILYTFLAFFFLGLFLLIRRPASPSFSPSFSTRVYLSFLIIALIPMVLFTLTSRSFFHQVFSQKITENTENQARFAQKIMEDYFFLQPESTDTEKTFLPDTLVSWISSAISSDVNLYYEGRLIASSRRDFFDYGLLPELLDGEVYFQIRHLNHPLVTQKQKIGHYSFHVLTTAYSFGEQYYLISLPFPLETEELNQTSRILFEFFLLISFFFIIIVALLARGLGQSIIRPIQLLLQATKEVSMGNLEVSIFYPKKDEMKTLIDRFNFMVKSLKQHQQELAEMSRKAAWAEMARKVAHEIKNPLTPIQLSAEHILRVYQDKREDFEQVLQQSIAYITSEVENLRRTAQEFLELAREASLQKESLDMKEFISNLIEPYQSILEGRISFQTEFTGENFYLEADPIKIRTVLRNLLTNAIEAIPEKGTIWIRVTSNKDSIMITIWDSGRGIPPETLKHVFDLYFSTKEGGTGLGLPIARKIIEEHGGRIDIQSKESRGTEVKIILPKSSSASTKK
jgi:signal transduction histidine kinase